MTDRDFEGRLRAGLRQMVEERASGALRASIFAIPDVVPASPQRRFAARWQFPRMSRFAPIALAATAVVVTILIGIGLVLRSPNIGPSPVPVPTHNETPKPTAPPAPGMFAYIQETGYHLGRLWVASVDGSGAHELLPEQAGNQQSPVWSPDGTRLLFSKTPIVEDAGGYIYTFRFYLTDASGGEPQLVDTGCVAPCVGDSDAAFSRDGTHLVFVRSLLLPPTPERPGPGKVPGPTPASVIATIDLLTGRVVELASTTIVDCPMLPGQRLPDVPNCGGLQNRDPGWSADGTQIVFTQDVPFDINDTSMYGELPPPPGPALFVVDADGRNLHQISPTGWPGDWSPDGARIVFQFSAYHDIVPNPGGTGWGYTPSSDLYTIRPDGTDLRQLTSDGNSYGPGWAPDGISSGPIWTPDGRILFAKGPFDEPRLWIMDADGSNATQLSLPPLPLGALPNQPAIAALTRPSQSTP
jgi:Tol biopolymer transport system component